MIVKKRIFSGIKPSGVLHIGNYLGAIKNWVTLQDKYDSIFCVVDLHAITVPQNPEELKKRTIDIARVYLASGIDADKCSIFIQSHVKEHVELSWILNTITKVSELERMTQFKDKSGENKEGVGMGLFDYPILMAADILLYDTQIVPVGEDQLQHIELTRAIANRFNKKFGDTFVIPESFVVKNGMRIMGLDNPVKKMSKSAPSEYNYITMNDSEAIIRKKIQKAVTDSGSEIVYQDDKPALKNLINIYSLLSGKDVKETEQLYKGKGYAEFKEGLADIVVDLLGGLQSKMKDFSDEKVMEILKQGAEKVRPLAKNKIDLVKDKLGFVK